MANLNRIVAASDILAQPVAMAPPDPDAPPVIIPSIGRRVWLWANGSEHTAHCLQQIDAGQAFDAGIVFVHDARQVNVIATGHTGGCTLDFNRITLVQTGDDIPEFGRPYVAWMPYQVKAAA